MTSSALGSLQVIQVPLDKSRPSAHSFLCAVQSRSFGTELTEQIKALAKRSHSCIH